MPAKSSIEDVLYGRKRSLVLEPALLFLSLIYKAAVRFRSFAYASGLFRTKRLPCKVVSIGNISLGGTGKTPAVIQIAGTLLRHGRRPAIVSRGYGRSNESAVVVVSDGSSVLAGADDGGDEPVLIAHQLPRIPVIVGSDRYRAGMLAMERFGPDMVILDDGFQHIRLARDLNIVLVDGADPFGSGRLFPAGILREPLSGLNRADAIIITRADDAADLVSLKRTIASHASAPVFTARYVPLDLMHVAMNKVLPLAALQGSRVFAFAGIARPRSFEALLRSLGAEVRGIAEFSDHHRYADRELAALQARAKDSGTTMLVTTEKDAVRIKGMSASGDIWALRIELEILEKDQWEKVLLGSL